MPVVSPDNTVYGEDGKVLLFSQQRFQRDVLEGKCCFMCGRAESRTVPFNDEHIIPDWLQKMANLYSQSVTLANRSTRRYGSHLIPCCRECNASLGERFEKPVSELLKQGYEGVKEAYSSAVADLLHAWAALIFLKMHLKDYGTRWNPDTRKAEGTIGEAYQYASLLHVYAIVRTAMLEGTVRDHVKSTGFVHRASATKFDPPFDYADHSMGCASAVRVGDLYLFNVFDDASISIQATEGLVARCGALSSPQAREVLCHLAYTNILIVDRPRFWSNFFGDVPTVDGHTPARWQVRRYEREMFGGMLYFQTQAHLEGIDPDDVKKGNWTFLLRDDGSFIDSYETARARDAARQTSVDAGRPADEETRGRD